jgi:hypothetical protein
MLESGAGHLTTVILPQTLPSAFQKAQWLLQLHAHALQFCLPNFWLQNAETFLSVALCLHLVQWGAWQIKTPLKKLHNS